MCTTRSFANRSDRAVKLVMHREAAQAATSVPRRLCRTLVACCGVPPKRQALMVKKGKHLCCASCLRTNGSSPMSPSPLAVLPSLRPSLPSHVEAPHVCCACSEHHVAGLCRSAVADPVRYLSHLTDPTIFKIFLFFLSLFLCCLPMSAPHVMLLSRHHPALF